MPKVITRTCSGRGEPSGCVKCGAVIKKGEEYYEWSFFRQKPRRQHTSHGPLRRSQLTNSKMSEVYGAVELAEDNIGTAKCPEDIASELESVAQTARDIGSEYADAVEAMGGAGEGSDNAERAEQLEGFADDLDNKAQDIRDSEPPEDEDEETNKAEAPAPTSEGSATAPNDNAQPATTEVEYSEEFLDDLRTEAYDALSELSI